MGQKPIHIKHNTFGSRLNDLITKKFGTRNKFCTETGLTRYTVLYYCENKRHPNAVLLKEICEKLGCSADYLLFGTEEYELYFESHTGNKVGNWHCGNCNRILLTNEIKKYCPYCGKKIKERKSK